MIRIGSRLSPVTVGSHPSHNRNQIGSRSSHGFRRSQTDHGQIFNTIILSTLCHIYSGATHACEFEQECQGQSITAEEKQIEFVNAEKTCWMHSAVREMRRKRVPRNHSRLDHGQIMIRIGSRLFPVTAGSHPSHNQNRNRVTAFAITDGSRVGSRSDPQQHYTIDSSRSRRVFDAFRFFLRFLSPAEALCDFLELSIRIHHHTTGKTQQIIISPTSTSISTASSSSSSSSSPSSIHPSSLRFLSSVLDLAPSFHVCSARNAEPKNPPFQLISRICRRHAVPHDTSHTDSDAMQICAGVVVFALSEIL